MGSLASYDPIEKLSHQNKLLVPSSRRLRVMHGQIRKYISISTIYRDVVSIHIGCKFDAILCFLLFQYPMGADDKVHLQISFTSAYESPHPIKFLYRPTYIL